MAGAQVIQARGDAAHGRGLALGNRILRERRIDADVHVRVDAARECQAILGVENGLRALRLNIGSELGDLSVLDRNIEAIDGGLVRADHAGILDHNIEKLVHVRHSLVYLFLRSSGVDAAS